MFDHVAKNLLQYWPSPTTTGLANNYVSGGEVPATMDEFTGRIDQNISDRTRLFARYSQKRFLLTSAGYYFGQDDPGGPEAGTPEPRLDFGASLTHTFSPTVVLNVTGGWARWTEGFHPQGYGFKPSTVGLPSFLDSRANFPNMVISGVYGLGAGYWSKTPRENRTIAADLNKIHGPHTFNAGFETIISPVYTTFIDPFTANFGMGMTNGPDPTAGNVATGFGFASFLLGTGSGGSYPVEADSAFMKKYAGWYFQDDWKATRKLTLNLGIRYDFQTAPTERFNRIARFDFTDPNPISQEVGMTVPGYLSYVGDGKPRGLYDPQYTNVQPRVGFAYKWTDKLVMRSGFGLYNVPAVEMSDYQGMELYGFGNVNPWVATVDGITPVDLLSNPFPNGLTQAVGKAHGELTNVGQSIEVFEPKRPTPYMEEWTFGLQYAASRWDSFDVTYAGNRGVHLIFSTEPQGNAANQLTPATLAMATNPTNPVNLFAPVANPFFGSITAAECGLNQPTIPRGQLLRPFPEYCNVENNQMPGAFSSYQSVKFNYNHQWSQGLQVLVSFTISKYIDDSSGPEGWATPGQVTVLNAYNLAAEKSLDFDDIPKSLVISYIYSMPYGHGRKYGSDVNKFANATLGGWQISGVTTFKDGFPLAIGDDTNNTNAFSSAQRPNLVGNPHVANPTVNEWFNTDAFAQPAPYTFGDTPRTMPNLRCAGINNWDINFQKSWSWGEKRSVQLRGELYNAFNHPYFYAPDQFLGDPTFGQVTIAGFGRSIQLGMKIIW
jgi:hypothetical protein